MAETQFDITFRGVRGSIPTPLTAADVEEKIKRVIELATPEDLKDIASRKSFFRNLPPDLSGCFGGNSSCVQVKANGQHLIFDAGTGLRVLGHHYMQEEFGRGEGEAHLFLSHTHWDHIMGMPFFVPFYQEGNRFKIYGVHPGLKDRLIHQQDYEFFPVPFHSFEADVEVVDLTGQNELVIGDVVVRWKEMDHPGRSFAYRVECNGRSFVYATDAEYKRLTPEELRPAIDFFSDTDLLIFDSQYTFIEGIEKEDWGHSSTFIGVDLAVAANVKKIAFYHHEPTYSDSKLVSILGQTRKYLKAIAPESPLEMIVSQEGRTFDLLQD